MLDVEFYRPYNGLRARDLMPCLCRDFAIFTKVCRVFYHLCRDFLLSLHIDLLQIGSAVIILSVSTEDHAVRIIRVIHSRVIVFLTIPAHVVIQVRLCVRIRLVQCSLVPTFNLS